MTTSKDIRIENIIDCIKQIASEEFQEKGWVKNEIHDYCTFVETMCGLFDDANFEFFIENEAADLGYTKEQIEKLDRLRKALNEFDTKHGCYRDPVFIVRDSDWIKIRGMAREALKSLGIENYLDPSKEILKYILLNRIYSIADSSVQARWRLQEKALDEIEAIINDIFKTAKIEKIIDHYKDYEMAENQLQSLRQFYNALKAYQAKVMGKDLKTIIEDPQWHQIQALAKEVVEIFDFKP